MVPLRPVRADSDDSPQAAGGQRLPGVQVQRGPIGSEALRRALRGHVATCRRGHVRGSAADAQGPGGQGALWPGGPPAAGQVRGLRAPPPSATGHHERSESIVQSCKRPGGYRGQDKADACGGQGGQGLVCSRRGAWRRAGVRCLQGGVKERETTCKEEANGRDFVSTDDGRVKETCLRYGTEQTRGLLLFNDRGVGRHISVRTIFPRESGQDSPLVPSFGHSLFHSSSTYFVRILQRTLCTSSPNVDTLRVKRS